MGRLLPLRVRMEGTSPVLGGVLVPLAESALRLSQCRSPRPLSPILPPASLCYLEAHLTQVFVLPLPLLPEWVWKMYLTFLSRFLYP